MKGIGFCFFDSAMANQPVRWVQKNTLCPESFRGRGVKRPLRAGGRGPRTELARSKIVDQVQCERDHILFATGKSNAPAVRPVARQTVVPAHFTAADYILPERVIDCARP